MNNQLKQGCVGKARQVFKGALVPAVDTVTVLVAGWTAASFSTAFQHQSELFWFPFDVVEGKLARLQWQQFTRRIITII
jgi:hypothetical protein